MVQGKYAVTSAYQENEHLGHRVEWQFKNVRLSLKCASCQFKQISGSKRKTPIVFWVEFIISIAGYSIE